jgi:hypothetical protein
LAVEVVEQLGGLFLDQLIIEEPLDMLPALDRPPVGPGTIEKVEERKVGNTCSAPN